MATFAPPVRRDAFLYTFLYSSILYVDPGNGSHHPRASIAELAALLRPDAPNLYSKSSTPAPATPSKDPAWHWYAAQLIHYGLPFTKEKNTAKVRLLDALNQFKLEVPAWVVKIEGELKEEWEGENRKLKKAAGGGVKKGQGGKSAGGGGGTGVQVSPPSQEINVNVNVSLGSGLLSLAQADSVGQKGKRKRNDEPMQEKPTPKRVAKSIFASPAKSQSSPPAKIAPEIMVDSSPVKPVRRRTERTARRAMTQPYPIDMASSDSPYASSPVKEEDPSSEPGTIALSGTYSFPDISIGTWASMKVYRDADRGIWWATISLLAEDTDYEFVVKMDPGPTVDTLGQAVTLGWRMVNLSTEEVKFGTGCTGEATFSEGVHVRVVLRKVPGLGDVVLSGRRVPGPSRCGNLQEQWDDFRLAYER